MGKIRTITLTGLILLIKGYQYLISPLLIQHCCRFHPSCSHYLIDALNGHGIFQGCVLSLKRLLRCHPWCQGGFDPVPEKISYGN